MTKVDAKVREALKGGEQSRSQAIHDLASHPDEVFAWMGQGHHDKHSALILVPVLVAIGYPANERALPWLIEEIDRNAPAWHEIVQAVQALESAVIVPYFVRKVWERKIQDANWCYEVESICSLLLEMPHDYAAGCGPVVASLLTEPADPAQLDPAFLMDVLEKIGPGAASYALPSLLRLFERHPKPEFRSQATRLISTYSDREREPYRLILSAIDRQASP